MSPLQLNRRVVVSAVGVVAAAGLVFACQATRPKTTNLAAGDVASKVYVAPGQYDEFYSFLSGGFSGQVAVYGLPSGRLLKVIPVFSQNPENGYGYNDESKEMLQTTFGVVPWDDSHHPELSQTDGIPDGRWLFINANNTPRVARIDLTRFETDEILQIPNAAGGHASPFTTPNTKYIVSATRFSVPIAEHATSRSRATRRTSRARCRSSRPTSRARWTSRSRSSCRATTTTSATPARARPRAGSSSPRTTPSRRTRSSR